MCFKSVFQALFGCCLPQDNKNGVRNGFLRFSYRLFCIFFFSSNECSNWDVVIFASIRLIKKNI